THRHCSGSGVSGVCSTTVMKSMRFDAPSRAAMVPRDVTSASPFSPPCPLPPPVAPGPSCPPLPSIPPETTRIGKYAHPFRALRGPPGPLPPEGLPRLPALPGTAANPRCHSHWRGWLGGLDVIQIERGGRPAGLSVGRKELPHASADRPGEVLPSGTW